VISTRGTVVIVEIFLGRVQQQQNATMQSMITIREPKIARRAM